MARAGQLVPCCPCARKVGRAGRKGFGNEINFEALRARFGHVSVRIGTKVGAEQKAGFSLKRFLRDLILEAREGERGTEDRGRGRGRERVIIHISCRKLATSDVMKNEFIMILSKG